MREAKRDKRRKKEDLDAAGRDRGSEDPRGRERENVNPRFSSDLLGRGIRSLNTIKVHRLTTGNSPFLPRGALESRFGLNSCYLRTKCKITIPLRGYQLRNGYSFSRSYYSFIFSSINIDIFSFIYLRGKNYLFFKYFFIFIYLRARDKRNNRTNEILYFIFLHEN